MSQDSGSESDYSDEDIISVLIATDTHIGYMDKDPVRGDDSLNTFEEVLRIATANDVDMILLGGDVFHDNKPSRRVLFKTMEMIREYCMGDRPCYMNILSDQAVNFPTNRFQNVNYEDPNYNISIPIFSIHGNHDDPSGDGNLCALDLLSVNGLVNYFGRAPDISDIEISPILIEKGKTKLALFGLGNIRDERLHRTFENNKVTFVRPQENAKDWFNLFCLHQNRRRRSPKNYIPEGDLPKWLHLVVWGHEHDCLIDPEDSDQHKYYVTQPGSTIATSLAEGEAIPKHVGLLRIKGTKQMHNKIPLKTVRQFYIREVCLEEQNLNRHDNEGVKRFLTEEVEHLIQLAADERQAEEEEEGHDNDNGGDGDGDVDNHAYKNKRPELPLVRLKVDYSGGYTPFNISRFGQQFAERVANAKEILIFHRKKEPVDTNKKKDAQMFTEALENISSSTDNVKVEDLLKETFQQTEYKLKILGEQNLLEALNQYVNKEENDSIKSCVQKTLKDNEKHLLKHVRVTDSGDLLLDRASAENINENLTTDLQSRYNMEDVDPNKTNRSNMNGGSDDNHPSQVSGRGRGRASRGRGAPSKTRGSRGGRGSRGSRGRGSSSGTRPSASRNTSSGGRLDSDSEPEDLSSPEESDYEEVAEIPKKRAARKPKASAAPVKRTKQSKISTFSKQLESDDEPEVNEFAKNKRKRTLPFGKNR